MKYLKKSEMGVVAHTCVPSIWALLKVWGPLGYNKTLSQTNKKKRHQIYLPFSYLKESKCNWDTLSEKQINSETCKLNLRACRRTRAWVNFRVVVFVEQKNHPHGIKNNSQQDFSPCRLASLSTRQLSAKRGPSWAVRTQVICLANTCFKRLSKLIALEVEIPIYKDFWLHWKISQSNNNKVGFPTWQWLAGAK